MYDYEDYWHNPFEYTYDNLGNISTVSRFGILRQSFVYDELGQLTRENNKDADRTYLYSYDSNGNITMAEEYPYTTGNINYSLLLDARAYFYNSNWGDKLTNLNGTNISYDTIGNPLNWRGTISSINWDGRRLESLNTICPYGDPVTIYFGYNESGVRTSKNFANSMTPSDSYNIEYILDGSRIIKEISSLSISPHTTNTIYYYYDDTGSVIGFNYDGADYYYGKNLQGDIVSIYSSNKVEVVQYRYDAWGNIISMTGSFANTVGRANPFRYRGYYYDTETGLFYVGARYYDPEIGRWLSPEPNVDAGEFDEGAGLLAYNVYAYCANNPVNFYDPSGEAILTCILVGAGIGLLAGGLFGAYRASKNGYTPRDGWRYWKYVVGYGVVGGTAGALIGWGAGVLIPKFGAVMAAKSITSGGGVGYATFQQLKNSLGSPGWGKQWHHIVEQCQSVKSGFSTFWINNSNNVINITKQVHQKVSAHYSSIQSHTNGLRVRDWLAGQSFQKQYEYGVKILRQLGVKI